MLKAMIPLALLAAIASDASAQNFQLETKKSPVFTFENPAKKKRWVYIPPATKMFVSHDGDTLLFPPLFPETVFFRELESPPNFISKRFTGSFTAYEVGRYYIALKDGYVLFSATVKNGQLFILARDRDGDFVKLTRNHFSIFLKDGSPVTVEEIVSEARNISVLVDRSGSVAGYDTAILNALREVSETPISDDLCGIYEFGSSVRVIQAPMRKRCGEVFEHYNPSEADGGTPLYEAMEIAYGDAENWDGLSIQIIITDGEPTDSPYVRLEDMARTVPTFVLYVGDHRDDYIAPYSTAHAISQSGVQDEISDFLRGLSFSVSGHQTFSLRSSNGS